MKRNFQRPKGLRKKEMEVKRKYLKDLKEDKKAKKKLKKILKKEEVDDN
ncbi:MAG TPA: hypothetical protein PLZ62_00175 [bacterium]|nr:hypothetical protein [bacterium]